MTSVVSSTLQTQRGLSKFDRQEIAGNLKTQSAQEIYGLFEALERDGIAYCISHGAKNIPLIDGSDIDVVISRSVSLEQLEATLRQYCTSRSMVLERLSPGAFIVIYRPGTGPSVVLHLDFAFDCEAGGRLVMTGEEMMATRRHSNGIFVPETRKWFIAYLVRCTIKRRLDGRRMSTLEQLWRADPAGCAAELPHFFGEAAASEIAIAFGSGDLSELHSRIDELGRLATRHTSRVTSFDASGAARRTGRLVGGLLRPRGLSVVMLGPDGAGKSSVIEALEAGLGNMFNHTKVRGFAPPLHRLLRRGPKRTDTPHAYPKRSLPVSMIRVAYWFLYENWSRLPLHITKARGGLVLYDRHLTDILVDPVRYRYGGPRRLLNLVVGGTPKPDLIILLHAPGEVLHARKPEMTLAETQRQSQAYLELVRGYPNGHVVDATLPFPAVLRAVEDIILAKRKATF